MGRTHGAPNIRIALHDRIGQKIWIDFTKKYLQLLPAPREIRESFQVFNHLGIDQNAGGGLVLPDQGGNELNKGRSAMQIAGKWCAIQEILSHTASGGVGWDSCRMRSNACSSSSHATSLHAPASARAAWVVSSTSTRSASCSSVK